MSKANFKELLSAEQYQRTAYGQMNKWNRVYFGVTLFEQAGEMGFTCAELSAMENNRAEVTIEDKEATKRYWLGILSREQV